jgi:hypothetical protein
LANGEGYALSFTQIIELDSDATGLMEEVLRPVSSRDESEALVSLPFDRAGRRCHS